MTRKQKKFTRREAQGRKVVPEGVDVRAVKATSGRPATSLEAEIAPERLEHALGEPSEVQQVVAQVPGAGGDLEDQQLSKVGEQDNGPGERVVRYAGTIYRAAGADLKVQVRTQAGTVEARPGDVHEADKPAGRGTRQHKP